MKKFSVASAVVGAVLGLSVAAVAQEPVRNIDPARHGNLAAAQDLIRQAFDRITTAQQDNRYDLGGHAGRAKSLLQQASEELRMAADAANRR